MMSSKRLQLAFCFVYSIGFCFAFSLLLFYVHGLYMTLSSCATTLFFYVCYLSS